MPHVETPAELADWLADQMGVYGACPEGNHDAESPHCRPCFVSEITTRIRQAVANEKLLAGAQEPKEGGSQP